MAEPTHPFGVDLVLILLAAFPYVAKVEDRKPLEPGDVHLHLPDLVDPPDSYGRFSWGCSTGVGRVRVVDHAQLQLDFDRHPSRIKRCLPSQERPSLRLTKEKESSGLKSSEQSD